MTSISTTLTLPCGLQLPNRLVKAAMTERLATPENQANDQLIRLYQCWADGGIGLQITGNVIVDRAHLEAPGNVAIDGMPNKAALEKLTQWARVCQVGGGKVMMQLSHAGRQTMKMVNSQPLAPSAVKVNLPGGQFGMPQVISAQQIEQLIEKYAVAVRVARLAGFNGVQIHAAHGYLMSQFLSPRTNQRDDQWGGSLENRARLLLDVIKVAKAEAADDFAIAVKLNSSDFQKGGFSYQDSMAVIGMLNEIGLDFVEISGGNYEQPKMMDIDGLKPVFDESIKASTRQREAYFLDYAREVMQTATMPLMVTGGFRSSAAMNQALVQHEADLVGLARPLCVDAQAPSKLLSGELLELPKWEKRLNIGPGLLSDKSSWSLMKAINGFGVQAWYYRQLHELAHGRDTNPDFGVFSSLLKMGGIDAKMARAYRKTLS